MYKEQILLIDDDADFSELMADILEMEGYALTAHSQTNNIIQLVQETKPALVLLDYLLPGINGAELSRILHNCPEMKSLPVVLLSAYPKEKLELAMLTCTAFIAKPFDLWDFLACIKEQMRLGKLQSQYKTLPGNFSAAGKSERL